MDVSDEIGMHDTPNGLAWGKKCTLKCFPFQLGFISLTKFFKKKQKWCHVFFTNENIE
jgi:hypothetical protein